MTTPPVEGEFYLVPCVHVTAEHIKAGGCDGMSPGWWAVMGPEHEDAKFFDFPHRHWHYDARFLSASQVRNRGRRSHRVTLGEHEFILGFPLTNHGTLGAPEMRRKRCRSATPPAWHVTLPNLPKLERALRTEGRTLRGNCKVCPHRGFPLASMPVEADGGITCPGHGLRWHAETGEMLPRGAHRPVRAQGLRVVRVIEGRIIEQAHRGTSELWRFEGPTEAGQRCASLRQDRDFRR
jgi:nitrite reductase/ring-hydroxylating ferredoxin subunit